MNIGPKYQRGYAVIPYLASFFTAGASTAGAAATVGTAAAGAAGAAVGTAAVGALASKALAPKAPSQAGLAPPTLDQAKQAQQQNDRLLQRKGVLANIYSPQGGTPSVGTTKLLGG